ncbi:MAG: ATP-binding protein [Planctomycetota bacterium]
MSLRGKIILAMAAVMFMVLCILLLSSFGLTIAADENRRHELERIMCEAAPRLYAADSGRLTDFMDAAGFIADWRLVEGDRIVAGRDGVAAHPVGPVYCTVALQTAPVAVCLHFLVERGPVINPAHTAFLATGLVGTLFVVVVLYLLLSRLVIRPIDIVIRAARDGGRGIKPAHNPIPGRRDEAGVMVAEFHKLLDEIHAFRCDMENRVAAARAEMEKTLGQLAVTERLSATGKMAAGVAHEINNPVGGMLNAVATLKKTVTGAREREYLDLLEECLHRIEHLVRELLIFVRPAGVTGPVELAGCVAFAERMVHHQVRDRQIAFTATVPAGLCVQGNAAELQQMLLNLYLNAIDSIAGPGGRLEVAAAAVPGGGIELSVTDNGCGIPAEVLPHVFDLFFTTKAPGQGTGLGLGITHRIVHNHGGAIRIDSAPGRGTRIIIAFPPEGGRP